MGNRVKSLRVNLTQSLGFVPGVVVAMFAVLGVGLVELDSAIDLDGVEVVFQGDGSAARSVLSVIAGSLITVAGLTFSLTMVVLQLASSQFSPRILRTFFGDRVTQITIGTYVGIFVYALLVLRAVGSFGDAGFVPRLSVTVATLLGIVAVVLLVVFLNHVSQLVQVSHVTAAIGHATLARIDTLYPEPYGEPRDDVDAGTLLERWRERPSGTVLADAPGYVQRVGVDDLVGALAGKVRRLAVLVCPGDFVSVETPVMEVWPPSAADDLRGPLIDAVAIASERDLDQDADFGIRQLTDTALKAMSPGINDPMTAITCVGYLRSILVRLTERSAPARVRHFERHDLTVILRHRSYEEHLDGLLQIGRYTGGDAWVAGSLLQALAACAAAATRCGAHDRARVARTVAAAIAEQALAETATELDRATIARELAAVESAARRRGR